MSKNTILFTIYLTFSKIQTENTGKMLKLREIRSFLSIFVIRTRGEFGKFIRVGVSVGNRSTWVHFKNLQQIHFI